jgi:hypothetical protein
MNLFKEWKTPESAEAAETPSAADGSRSLDFFARQGGDFDSAGPRR